jgi:hypothetical protein
MKWFALALFLLGCFAAAGDHIDGAMATIAVAIFIWLLTL